MIKRFILAISIALILVGGLLLILLLGKSNTFFGILDKAINGELFKPERAFSVNVNVYEVKNHDNPLLGFDKAFEGDLDLEEALKQYFIEYNNTLGALS
ncbi:MAG: hypothetical protein FWG44_08785, partial [Oscillospiraceae bacterium]|nr:hypothetical protein [Oscillospiraceae bacterium]